MNKVSGLPSFIADKTHVCINPNCGIKHPAPASTRAWCGMCNAPLVRIGYEEEDMLLYV